MSNAITIKAFFDPKTWTVTYVISDSATQRAAIVDPVLDYDFKSGRTSTEAADAVLSYLAAQHLQVDWILETHAHADHLSGAHYLQQQVGGRIAIGEHIRSVQAIFKKIFNLERDFIADGSQFDCLLQDGQVLYLGDMPITALWVPGHTLADMAYQIGDAVFVGDTLFMPDVGTARADFPGGDARALYRSIRKLLDLPKDTRLFVCHDYPPPTRAPRWQSSVAEQRAQNIHVHDGVTEDQFANMRGKRDATLDMPTLILPSIQANIRAGALPPPEENGVSYFKIPINVLGRPPEQSSTH